MRRWIAILMMIVLPLQLSWAVAANYCLDEQGAGAQHFGHHVHSHHDDANAAKKLTKSGQQADHDCGCSGHLCGAHLVPEGLVALPNLARKPQLVATVPGVHQSTHPPQIERPNWTSSL